MSLELGISVAWSVHGHTARMHQTRRVAPGLDERLKLHADPRADTLSFVLGPRGS
jgi:hypothetical protein